LNPQAAAGGGAGGGTDFPRTVESKTGDVQHISSLCAYLNKQHGEKVSPDRLQRYAAKCHGETSDPTAGVPGPDLGESTLQLFGDVAVQFEDAKKKPKGWWKVGSVQRIIKGYESGKGEWRNPVDLTNKPKNVTIELIWYDVKQGGGGLAFTKDPSDTHQVSLDAVECALKLSFDSATEVFTMNRHNHTWLQDNCYTLS
jgi:hypothetical protein